ncbi:MAG: ATP-binding cassette domain-containing protein [Prevotellaceae bacterium]|jgi:cell division transport system ATP-binding protein|nr:ATP-binding cassette domain-containing protein [Prevotellaceae bacterium]
MVPKIENPDVIVQLENVDIIKDQNLILSGVSFSVAPGEWVYLVGKVGSGKTSIVKVLIGEIMVETGKAQVVGFDLRRLKTKHIPLLRRKIGVVFQDFQLLMERSVFDNLAFVLKTTGWRNKKEMEQRIYEVLDKVGMRNKSHKMPHQLSGGEQQRVAIARAVLNNPQLILVDEPTGNLDEETAMGIMLLFSELHRNYGLTILMVTHNMAIVQRFPGRIFKCGSGKCVPCEMHPEIEFDMDNLS